MNIQELQPQHDMLVDKLIYDPNNPDQFKKIKKNIRVLEIEADNGNLLKNDALFSTLKENFSTSFSGLVLIDLFIKETNIFNDNQYLHVVIEKLKIFDKSLFFQCRSSETAVVFEVWVNDDQTLSINHVDLYSESNSNTCKSILLKNIQNLLLCTKPNILSMDNPAEAKKLITDAAYANDSLSILVVGLKVDIFSAFNMEELSLVAEESSLNTIRALFSSCIDIGSKGAQKKIENMLNQKNKFGKTFLSIAVERGQEDVVQFYLKCGADVNIKLNNKKVIDIASKNKKWKIAQLLLENDSEFPSKKFLFDSPEMKDLKEYIEKRDSFHQMVQDNKIDSVKAFYFKNPVQSKYCLNQNNESVLYQALLNKHFDIYAYLFVNGFLFYNDSEDKKLKELDDDDRSNLQDFLHKSCSSLHDCHIPYLLSKSQCLNKKVADFEERIKKMYEEINKIPEISQILQVIQYGNDCTISFDFERKNISGMGSRATEGTKGMCDITKGAIYVAAGSTDEQEVLGTLAHELTHFAMQVVFENSCNPYKVDDDTNQKKFENIIKKVDKEKGSMDDIIQLVFQYAETDQAAELIVRINHLLAKYGTEVAVEHIAKIKDLNEYFKDYVLKACIEYCQNSHEEKSKQNIRNLNNYSYLFEQIESKDICFMQNQPNELKSYIDGMEKLIIQKTKNTFLSCVRLYQLLQVKKDLVDKYLLFGLEQFTRRSNTIQHSFIFSKCQILIVEVTNDEIKKYKDKLNYECEWLIEAFKNRHEKKFIIIAEESILDLKIFDKFTTIKDSFLEQPELFQSLTESSKKYISQTKVEFQGYPMTIGDLLPDFESKGSLNLEELSKVLENNLCIGRDLKNEKTNFYVKRSVIHQNTVKNSILQDPQISNLVITCSNSFADELLMSPNACLFDTENYTDKKIIILRNDGSEEKQFDELSVKLKKEFNWLIEKDKKLACIKSSSDFQKINDFRDANGRVIPQNEMINDKQELIMVSDLAGMGKSTLFASLSIKIKEHNPKAWVFKINLNDFKEEIEKLTISNHFSIDIFVNSFLNLCEFEKKIFRQFLNCDQRIEILFDSLDEIQENRLETMIWMIKNLSQTTRARIWIAARTNIRKKLEDSFQTYSYSLERFSSDEKKEFLENIWKENKLSNDSVVELIDKFDTFIRDEEFSSNPLHLRMLAEIFSENPASFNWKIDLPDIFERFINKKFLDLHLFEKKKINIYNPGTKEEIDIKGRINSFQNSHQILALQVLLSDGELKSLNVNNHQINESIENIRSKNHTFIIANISDSANVQFVHRTYAEYLATLQIFEYIKKEKEKEKIQKLFQIFDKYVTQLMLQTLIKKLNNLEKNEFINIFDNLPIISYCSKNGFINMIKILLENSIQGYSKFLISDPESKTPLHYAVECGNLEFVKMLKSYDANFLDTRDKFGKTTIFYAAKNAIDNKEKGIEILDQLLQRSPKIDDLKEFLADITDYCVSKTRCAYAGQFHPLRDVQRKLLIKNPDISLLSDEYELPRLLSYYFMVGDLYLVKRLLRRLPKEREIRLLNAEDNGHTPLDRILMNEQITDSKCLKMVDYIYNTTEGNIKISFGVSPIASEGNDIFKLLQVCSKNGFIKTLRKYIKYEDKNKFNELFWIANSTQQSKIVRYFLTEHKSKLFCEGNSPLHTACDSKANIQTISSMIEYKNTKNDKGETPLFQAVYASHFEAVKYLFKNGADPINPKNSILLKKAMEIMEFLKKKRKYTPVYKSSCKIVQYLEADAQNIQEENFLDTTDKAFEKLEETVNDRDTFLKSINGLFKIIKSDKPHLIFREIYQIKYEQSVLLREIIRYRDIDGETLLEYAVGSGYYKIALFLMKHGSPWLKEHSYKYAGNQKILNLISNINNAFDNTDYNVVKSMNPKLAIHVRHENDDTLLHSAVSNNNLKVVDWLLKNNADVNAANTKGVTPISLAQHLEHLDIYYRLKNSNKK